MNTIFRLLLPAGLLLPVLVTAQPDANTLVQQVRQKIELVSSYQATGFMKTNVSFLKVPEAAVQVYFQKPNQLKIKNEKGLSFVPKGVMNINLNQILAGGRYSIIDAGYDAAALGVKTRVIKLLPNDDLAEIVLSTLYIDESRKVILRARTTTRENGTYQLDMTFGKYSNWGLPDKIVLTFNTKDFKLPKGVTFDFDDGSKPAPSNSAAPKMGRAEITFTQYTINKGVPAGIF